MVPAEQVTRWQLVIALRKLEETKFGVLTNYDHDLGRLYETVSDGWMAPSNVRCLDGGIVGIDKYT